MSTPLRLKRPSPMRGGAPTVRARLLGVAVLIAVAAGACTDTVPADPADRATAVGDAGGGSTDAGASSGASPDASDSGRDSLRGDATPDTPSDAGVDPAEHGDPPTDTHSDAARRDEDAPGVPDARSPGAPTPIPCLHQDCAPHGACDETTGTCLCTSGTWFDGTGCAPVGGDACVLPVIPRVSPVAAGEALHPAAAGHVALHAADARNPASVIAWSDGTGYALDVAPPATVRVAVDATDPNCPPGARAHFVVDVRASYPGPVDAPDTTAVALDDARVAAWASAVVSFEQGAGADDPAFADPAAALGPAEGTSFNVVTLGHGGAVTVTFEAPIADGVGDDLAVFENGFSDGFVELAVVEVSSDGVHFAAFAAASQGATPVGPYAMIDTRQVGQLAGKYRQGYGTPFDLAVLRQHPLVQRGDLDLQSITHVRVADVGGDGRVFDAFGRPIYAPFPSVGSAGFDLDAVAVLRRGLDGEGE